MGFTKMTTPLLNLESPIPHFSPKAKENSEASIPPRSRTVTTTILFEVVSENAIRRSFSSFLCDGVKTIMNSATMLLEGGCLKRQDEKLVLTATGNELCQDIYNCESKMLKAIIDDLDLIQFKYDSIDLSSLYQQFWIAL